MPISDLPALSMLRTKMQWHQERQKLLAENVANADTPSFRPRDLTPLKPNSPMGSGSLGLSRTTAAHLTSTAGEGSFGAGRRGGYESRPSGNAVNLEDEMLKVSANQMDYQAAASLYSRSLGLLKTAIGKR